MFPRFEGSGALKTDKIILVVTNSVNTSLKESSIKIEFDIGEEDDYLSVSYADTFDFFEER